MVYDDYGYEDDGWDDGAYDYDDSDWETQSEDVGEILDDATYTRFSLDEDTEPIGLSDYELWEKMSWGYQRDGWKVLVGKNDGIKKRCCIVDPNDIVRAEWLPVKDEEDISRRIDEADELIETMRAA